MSRRYSPSPDRRRYHSPPPRDRYRSPPPRRSRRGSSRDKDTGCLFVGNIPYTFRENDIRDLFRKMGDIETVTIGMNHKTGQPKGHAFVQFYNPQDAQETHYKFQDFVIEGRPLHLDWDAGRQNKMRSYRYSRRGPYDRPRYSRRRSPSYSPPRRRYSRSPPRRKFSRSPPRRRDSRSPPRRRESPLLSHNTPPRGSRTPPRTPPRNLSPRRSSFSPPRRSPPPRDSRSPIRNDSRSPVRRNSPITNSPNDRDLREPISSSPRE